MSVNTITFEPFKIPSRHFQVVHAIVKSSENFENHVCMLAVKEGH